MHPLDITPRAQGAVGPLLPLRAEGLSYRYDARPEHPVLTDLDVTVAPGRVVGVIGENGSGKSTLLRLLAGELRPDHGLIQAPASLGVLGQAPTAPAAHDHDGDGDGDSTVAALIAGAAAPLRELETRLESLAADMAQEAARAPGDDRRPGPEPAAQRALARAWDEALAEAQRRRLWTLDARVSAVLTGLGVGGLARERPLVELSGGQRRRLELAAALLGTPAGLLLDEPTNHLDDDATDFLVAELRAWDGPVLVASHDRWFLDAVVDGLVDLDPGLDPEGRGGGRTGTAWSGGYTSYLQERARLRETWAARWREQQEHRAHWEAQTELGHADVFHSSTARSEARASRKFFADRAAATLDRRTRAAHRRLEELERRAVPPPPAPLRLSPLPAPTGPGTRGEPLLVLDQAGIRGRLEPVDLVVRRGEHLLVTGPNGAGKTTLLQLLGGAVPPDRGQALRAAGLRIGVLAQDAARHEAPEEARLTPAQLLERAWTQEIGPDPILERGPGAVELGLLSVADLSRPLAELSPGQRRRFELARVLVRGPEVLLLDEPTNHLSLALAEELEAELARWPGTVVLCTHDRWLRSRWSGPRLRLDRSDPRP